LPYSDYSFLAEELALREAQTKRDNFEAVSFGAYQVATFKGYEESWTKYKKNMGFRSDSDSQKVDKEEKKEVVKTAVAIHEQILRARDVKKKNI